MKARTGKLAACITAAIAVIVAACAFAAWMLAPSPDAFADDTVASGQVSTQSSTEPYLALEYFDSATQNPSEVLDGRDFAIITENVINKDTGEYYPNGTSVQAQSFDASNTKLKGQYVNILEDEDSGLKYIDRSNYDITVWHFEYDSSITTYSQWGATYYPFHLSTIVDGQTKYLHIAEKNLSLSDEVQTVYAGFRNATSFRIGRVRICFTDNESDINPDINRTWNDERAAGGYAGVKDDSPADWHTLAAPAYGVVSYSYKQNTDDAGSMPTTLPAGWTESVTDSSYTIASPTQTWYYSKAEGQNGTMWKFQGWRGNDGKLYQPGDPMPADVVSLALTSQWVADPSPLTINYDINLNNTGALYIPKLFGMTGYTETIETGQANYYVRSLDQAYYQTRAQTFSNFTTWQFMGWLTEDGNDIVQGDDNVDLVARWDIFDSNGDGVINLKAQWDNSYHYPSGTSGFKNRYVNFFVYTHANAVDSNPKSDDTVVVDNNASHYSWAVGGAVATPSTVSSQPLLYANYDDDRRVLLNQYTTSGGSAIGAVAADRMIRAMDRTPVSTYFNQANGNEAAGNPEYQIQLTNVPTDEEVIEQLRAQVAAGTKTLYVKHLGASAEEVVSLDELTTDNYTIRWYSVKLQDNGWMIDGKLTPKGLYLAVQKTFVGNSDGIAQAKEGGFHIELSDSAGGNENYTLTLTDMTSEANLDGLIDETTGTYGYVEHDEATDTYTWIVRVSRQTTFAVQEYNYQGGDCDIVPQYSITSPNGNSEVSLNQWYGDIATTATNAPADEISPEMLSTAHLTNTYVRSNVFTIMKRDNNVQGTPMAGVGFIVTDSSGATVSLAKTENGYYTFWKTSSDAQLTFATTDDEGDISLEFAWDDLASFAGDYYLTEIVPNGYQVDGEPPKVRLTIKDSTEDPFECSTISDGGGTAEISVARRALPGAEEGSGIVAGVLVKNAAETVKVSVSKEWAGDAVADSVAVELAGYVNGEHLIDRQAVLSESNDWSCTWADLPARVSNNPVSYTVEEIKIGNYAKGQSGFDNWTATYGIVMRDAQGTVIQDTTREADARQIDVVIENRLATHATHTVGLGVVGATDPELAYQEGVQLKLYRQVSYGQTALQYNGQYVHVDYVKDIVTEQDLVPVVLQGNTTYYLEQTVPAEGFAAIPGLIKLTVSPEGELTVERDNAINEALVSHVPHGEEAIASDLVIGNDRIVPVPTGVRKALPQALTVLVVALGVGVVAGVVAVTVRRRRFMVD